MQSLLKLGRHINDPPRQAADEPSMIVFILRRFIQALLVLAVTSVIIFLGVYAIGDPLEILLPADASMA